MKYYLLGLLLVFFILSLGVGIHNFKLDKKERYSFLSMFPFELRTKKNEYLNLLFRIVLTVSIGLMALDALFIFYFNDRAIILTKFLAGLMVLSSIILLSLFILSFRSVRIHTLAISLFSSLVFMSYILFGYITIRTEFEYFYLAQTIISFVCAGILVILMMLPIYLNWSRYKKIKDENGNEIKERLKFNPLAVLEWGSIILSILLYILVSFSTY